MTSDPAASSGRSAHSWSTSYRRRLVCRISNIKLLEPFLAPLNRLILVAGTTLAGSRRSHLRSLTCARGIARSSCFVSLCFFPVFPSISHQLQMVSLIASPNQCFPGVIGRTVLITFTPREVATMGSSDIGMRPSQAPVCHCSSSFSLPPTGNIA